MYTFTSCLHKHDKQQHLDTYECQTNGMQNSPIFSVLKKAIGAPPDVTSYIMKFLNPCVQMVYYKGFQETASILPRFCLKAFQNRLNVHVVYVPELTIYRRSLRYVMFGLY